MQTTFNHQEQLMNEAIADKDNQDKDFQEAVNAAVMERLKVAEDEHAKHLQEMKSN